jgi:hypothetical protein
VMGGGPADNDSQTHQDSLALCRAALGTGVCFSSQQLPMACGWHRLETACWYHLGSFATTDRDAPMGLGTVGVSEKPKCHTVPLHRGNTEATHPDKEY